MKTVLNEPFVSRSFPSLSAGRNLTVRVKEIPLSEFPKRFVERSRGTCQSLGFHLLCGSCYGMRAWSIDEMFSGVSAGKELPEENPWMEVWEIESTDQRHILDLAPYTGFAPVKERELFQKFHEIMEPIISKYSGAFEEISNVGSIFRLSDPKDRYFWSEIVGPVYDFNKEFRAGDASRKETLEAMAERNSILFEAEKE